MVPFAEVVLITAMEYQRKDDSPGQGGHLMVGINIEEADEPKEEGCKTCWLPLLITIGTIYNWYKPDIFACTELMKTPHI